MRKYTTTHFSQRLNERSASKDAIIELFEDTIKLIKKKKLHPDKAFRYDERTYKIYNEWVSFIYSKIKGKYVLITFYQRNWYKCNKRLER